MQGLSTTVIIPAYNSAGTIRRAVDSVLAQSCVPEEILVVDDGSTDDLEVQLAGYSGRVTLLRKRNGGAGSGRNLGIERAHGELIAFLDSDDYWLSGKLEFHQRLFREYPEIGFTASAYRFCEAGQEEHAKEHGLGRWCDRVLRLSPAEAFEAALTVGTPTVVVRRETLGDHRFDEKLRTAEDRDLWIRLLAAGPAYLTSTPLVTVILQPGSLSRTDPEADYPNMLTVIGRHREMMGVQAARRWEARALFGLSWGRYATGQPVRAMSPLLRSLWLRPAFAVGWWLLAKCAARAARLAVSPRRQELARQYSLAAGLGGQGEAS